MDNEQKIAELEKENAYLKKRATIDQVLLWASSLTLMGLSLFYSRHLIANWISEFLYWLIVNCIWLARWMGS